MKIGIDVRSLEDGAEHRGIGRFAKDLIEAMSRTDHHNDYVLFLSGTSAVPPKLHLSPHFRWQYAYGPGLGLRGIKYVRILFLLPRPLNIDTYDVDVVLEVDPYQRLKAKRTPFVLPVHDLIPFIFKTTYQHVHLGGYTPGHLIGYCRLRLRWGALTRHLKFYRQSSRIISISEHSKQDLLKLVTGLEPERIEVIPLAAGQLPPVPKSTPSELQPLEGKSFIFYVGGADPRKGLVSVAESMDMLWKQLPHVELVIAGKEVTDSAVSEAVKLGQTVASLSRPDLVHLLGFVTDAELAWLYAHAQAFVFPSRYEGFGLPILEAMQAGCPVVAYKNSSIPEVAGDAAILVEDGASMVPAITKVLEDNKLRDELIAKGKARAQQFSWEKTARETLRVLEEVGEK